jgi:hypothetical protein
MICRRVSGNTFREDDVGVLTLSSRHRERRNGGETVREDDVEVLTLSSRHLEVMQLQKKTVS